MNRKILPTSVEIDGVVCEFDADFRNILYIFEALNDPDLLDSEKVEVTLNLFYNKDDYKINVEEALKQMFDFIRAGEAEPRTTENSKPVYDWEQDFNLIVAPVNKNLGYDCRGVEFLHWWTFLSAFMEIGDCTLNTFMGIRDKLNKGKKLEKYEERIYKENRDKIILKKKYDKTTQSIIDEIMGGY